MGSRRRQFRHGVEVAAVRGAMWMAGALPLAIASTAGAAIGRFAYDVVRARRRVSVDNISRALGVGAREASAIARASYANMGRSFMEFAGSRRMSRERLVGLMNYEGLEHLEAARSAGRGAVLVAGHLGNWEWSSAGLAAAGFPVDFVVGQQTNARIDEVINDLRRGKGAGIIHREMALRRVMQALAAGRFVALLVDQDARKGGVMVEFLGRPASTVRGPALFAIRRRCPIIPYFVFRENGRHRAIVEAPIHPDVSLDEDAAVRDLTQRYTDRLSYYVRQHPTEYFWPHRRWKTIGIQSKELTAET